MKCRAIFTVAIMAVVFGSIGYAQEHPCTNVEAQKAEAEVDSLRSWDDLYKSFKLYKQCDDGAIGEGYSESVARILADHWSTISRLETLGAKDPAFRRFILKHVDGTIASDDIVKIKKNASVSCPKNLQKFCTDLRMQIERSERRP